MTFRAPDPPGLDRLAAVTRTFSVRNGRTPKDTLARASLWIYGAGDSRRLWSNKTHTKEPHHAPEEAFLRITLHLGLRHLSIIDETPKGSSTSAISAT